jgi:hypothetical protein
MTNTKQLIVKNKDNELEIDTEWKKGNMEYDLCTTQWIIDKACKDEHYAQNLYAAMCNNKFIKNDIWSLLKDITWSCSWRRSGGIVADMLQKGDYLDWYCSGIVYEATHYTAEIDKYTDEGRARYKYMSENFVPEGNITQEIQDDLLKLGWTIAPRGDHEHFK